jgi:VanZ family protein
MTSCASKTRITAREEAAIMTPGNDWPSPLLRGCCLVAAIAVIFQLFYLGAQPEAAGLLQPPWDKIAHFFVYSTLTALLWKAAAGRMPVAVLAAVILVGGLDELHQAGLPGRIADFADFLVDAIAAVFTSAFMLLLDARAGAGLAAPPRTAGR